MRTREPRRIAGKPGSQNGRVSKKGPNEPKKVRKDFRRVKTAAPRRPSYPARCLFVRWLEKSRKLATKFP